MSRAAAAVAMHPPAFFQLSYARAQMRCPCSCPLRCVVYRIVYNPQAADGLTPSLACPVWFGPICVCLCLVRFSPFMSGPGSGLIWSGPVRSAPLRSAPL